MFPSKQRPIAIPQAEHQKLSGTLALLWGNAGFARPPIAFASFVLGIGLHDRAYGELDDLPIGGIPEQEWLDLTRRGFALDWADAAADAIVKHHLQRLVSYGQAPFRQAAAQEMAAELQVYLRQHHLDRALFTRIDRITRLCDDIAFAFCFESSSEGSVDIFPSWDSDVQVAIHYRVAAGAITVNPWPFCVESHTGYILGYQRDGYPHRLEPLPVVYTVQPQAAESPQP
jgi:hypothetical protein